MRMILILALTLATTGPVNAQSMTPNERKSVTWMLKTLWPESSATQRDQASAYVDVIQDPVGNDDYVRWAAVQSARALRGAVAMKGRGEVPSDDQLAEVLAYMLMGARAVGAKAPTPEDQIAISRVFSALAGVSFGAASAITVLWLTPALTLPVNSLENALHNLALKESSEHFTLAMTSLLMLTLGYQGVSRWVPARVTLPGSLSAAQSLARGQARRLFFDTFIKELGDGAAKVSRLMNGNEQRRLTVISELIFRTWSREKVRAACEEMLAPPEADAAPAA